MKKVFLFCNFVFLAILVGGCQPNNSLVINQNDKATNQPVLQNSQPAAQTAKEVVQKSCHVSSDCPLAMDYAILSNCPFASFCEAGKCVVVCPMWQHSDDINAKISYKVACQKESDCNCEAWDQTGKYRCACLDNQCVSVVADQTVIRETEKLKIPVE
ncbi:MAG: hypothetical protein WC508_02040 [Patescibacteria group bacterium]